MMEISFSPFSVLLRKIENKLFGTLSFLPKKPNGKRALVSYVKHPFLLSQSELNHVPHTNPFECLDTVLVLLQAGYRVDVIDWTDTTFVPSKKYDLCIDVHQNLERLKDILPKECIKIFYITGANWKFQNSSENKRLEELKERRGVSLTARRNIVPADNIEHCDFALALGSEFAKGTYIYAKKDIERIPLPSVVFYDSPETKDFRSIRNNFVWIGGGGAVHKGLDVTLECFKDLPNHTLTICGPIQAEKDFAELYRKELFETPSIKTVGRIDIRSKEFKDIIKNSVALIYPSCSEGQSGSVITALQAGLIPLISYESGVEVKDFGKILTDHSPEYLKQEVLSLSNKNQEELKKMAVSAWRYARQNHSREIFRDTIEKILRKRNLI